MVGRRSGPPAEPASPVFLPSRRGQVPEPDFSVSRIFRQDVAGQCGVGPLGRARFVFGSCPWLAPLRNTGTKGTVLCEEYLICAVLTSGMGGCLQLRFLPASRKGICRRPHHRHTSFRRRQPLLRLPRALASYPFATARVPNAAAGGKPFDQQERLETVAITSEVAT
jgi:hypothetical protein